MGMPGLPEILLIFGAIVLLFGAKKLPALGGAIGESLKNFKKGVSDNKKIGPVDAPEKQNNNSNNNT